MRVISGSRRGLRLQCIEGLDTRPTTDRVKESMFNLLGFGCSEAKVLDLFSGTGALAIEALSRGASEAVIVDSHSKAVDVIQKNLAFTRLETQAKVFCASWESVCDRFAGQTFDLVFLDPPYGKGLIPKVLAVIAQKGLLSADGQVLIEWDFTDKEPLPDGYETVKERKYGRTWVTIVTKEKNSESHI